MHSPYHTLICPSPVVGENPGPGSLDKIPDLFISSEIFFTEVVTVNHIANWSHQLRSRFVGGVAQCDHVIDIHLIWYV